MNIVQIENALQIIARQQPSDALVNKLQYCVNALHACDAPYLELTWCALRLSVLIYTKVVNEELASEMLEDLEDKLAIAEIADEYIFTEIQLEAMTDELDDEYLFTESELEAMSDE